MEGSWKGIAGCVVHVDVHGECVCCGWMQCSCLIAKGLFLVGCWQSIHSMHKTLLCML